MAALAVRYQLGEGVERDPKQALFWAYRAKFDGVGRAEATIKPMVAELGDEEADKIRSEAERAAAGDG
jgi:hypothetical protein